MRLPQLSCFVLATGFVSGELTQRLFRRLMTIPGPLGLRWGVRTVLGLAWVSLAGFWSWTPKDPARGRVSRGGYIYHCERSGPSVTQVGESLSARAFWRGSLITNNNNNYNNKLREPKWGPAGLPIWVPIRYLKPAPLRAKTTVAPTVSGVTTSQQATLSFPAGQR